MRAKIGDYFSLWGNNGAVCSGPHKRMSIAVVKARRCEAEGGASPHVIVRVLKVVRKISR